MKKLSLIAAMVILASCGEVKVPINQEPFVVTDKYEDPLRDDSSYCMFAYRDINGYMQIIRAKRSNFAVGDTIR